MQRCTALCTRPSRSRVFWARRAPRLWRRGGARRRPSPRSAAPRCSRSSPRNYTNGPRLERERETHKQARSLAFFEYKMCSLSLPPLYRALLRSDVRPSFFICIHFLVVEKIFFRTSISCVLSTCIPAMHPYHASLSRALERFNLRPFSNPLRKVYTYTSYYLTSHASLSCILYFFSGRNTKFNENKQLIAGTSARSTPNLNI